MVEYNVTYRTTDDNCKSVLQSKVDVCGGRDGGGELKKEARRKKIIGGGRGRVGHDLTQIL